MADNDAGEAKPFRNEVGVAAAAQKPLPGVDDPTLDAFMKDVRGIADYSKNRKSFIREWDKKIAGLEEDLAYHVKIFGNTRPGELKKMSEKITDEATQRDSYAKNRDANVQDYVTVKLKAVEWKGTAFQPPETPRMPPQDPNKAGFSRP